MFSGRRIIHSDETVCLQQRTRINIANNQNSKTSPGTIHPKGVCTEPETGASSAKQGARETTANTPSNTSRNTDYDTLYDDQEEEDMGSVETQGSMITHLISQVSTMH